MRKAWLLLCVVLLVTMLGACAASSIGIIGGADGPTAIFVSDGASVITKEEAEQAALTHAGLAADEVIFSRTELDADDGILYYDVEFHAANAEYEYEIHAETGEILAFEKET